MKTWFVALIAMFPLAAFAQGSEEVRLNQIRVGFNDRVKAQGDIWYGDGEFLKVVEAYKVRAELFPHEEEAWTDLIYMFLNTQNTESELAWAIRYRELNPTDPDASFPEANIYSRVTVQAYLKAIPLLEKSIAMTPPPHPNSFRILGYCYKKLDLLEAAIRTYKAMLKVYPDDAAAKANLRNAELEVKKRLGGV